MQLPVAVEGKNTACNMQQGQQHRDAAGMQQQHYALNGVQTDNMTAYYPKRGNQCICGKGMSCAMQISFGTNAAREEMLSNCHLLRTNLAKDAPVHHA